MIPAELKIRDNLIRPATILAPMAGVTDTVFRRVIRSLGSCGLIMTEFTSAEGLTRNSARTLHYLYFDADEHPIAAQIFGLPGIGRYFVLAALNRDYTLVLGVVIFYATFIIILNLLADLLYAVLDPRVSYRT